MGTGKWVIIAGLLMGSLASCSKDNDEMAAPSAGITSERTLAGHGLAGKYNIEGFEQDNKPEPMLKDAEIFFMRNGQVLVRGRGYKFKGKWEYSGSLHDHIKIEIKGDSELASKLSSEMWAVIEQDNEVKVLKAVHMESSKQMILRWEDNQK
jgi:hypothetical protein